MNSNPPAPAWARRQEVRRDLMLLHERRIAAVQLAHEIREESRAIVARCLEGRIRRETEQLD